jgi:hypothetical protein
MSRLRLCAVSLLSLAVGMLFGSPLASAQIIGADPAACRGGSSVCTHHLQSTSQGTDLGQNDNFGSCNLDSIHQGYRFSRGQPALCEGRRG